MLLIVFVLLFGLRCRDLIRMDRLL